ncbi:MAG: linear amide C-N hydrolase [Clostridia bacterium]|nr:linear amide C-N hydrolase [Clostridia bacterium]
MCTSLTLPTPDGTNLFGRTLDLDTHFGEAPTLTPRRYPFSFADCYPHTHHYALLGMAAVKDSPTVSGYPLYAEAMNEKGLCMAGLRFAESAVYAPRPEAGYVNLAPWELIPYLLGTCATVDEAKASLGQICLVDKPFSDTVGTAPLHWYIADADPAHGGLILEATSEGMKLYPDGRSEDSPYGIGVLANEPPYPEQSGRLTVMQSLRGDAPGLPGDYSSPSRFIRAATLRKWVIEDSLSPQTVGDDVAKAGKASPHTQFFRILAAVSPMAGAVMTPEGRCHRTLYTCCMDTAAGAYLYHTESDPIVRRISFSAQDLNREAPFVPNADRISHPY